LGVNAEAIAGPMTGVERVVGRIRGSAAGPTLIGVGGLHGNETAGVLALKRVLERLDPRGSQLRGELVALAGNRAALAEGRRYLSRDLNRSWTRDRLEEARRAGSAAQGEDREQLELQRALDEAVESARGAVFLLDLHTTSGPGVPFSAIMDLPSNRDFALRFPVPLVLGFGELVDGTFFGYLTGRGITSMVFEGGQHLDLSSVDSSESAVWLGLAETGLIQEAEFPEVAEAREALRAMAAGLPRLLEIKHRHPVALGDGFQMHPGFENFEPVSAGRLLAQDVRGDVRSPESGRLLLPLYQAQGDDGFFLIREVPVSE
jgi:predicted deacylase